MTNEKRCNPPLPELPPYSESISVKNLSYAYRSSCAFSHVGRTVLHEVNLSLPPSSICLLIGANGSGKSTLLRLLSGRHLAPPQSSVSLCGLNAYSDSRLNFHRSYLSTDWGMASTAFGGMQPLKADIPVRNMMEALQNSYPSRRDELASLLSVDLDWRMHELSDGQRRRVQLLIGLVRPFKVLLLDEITTCLDVCVRVDLLLWLKREVERTGATVVYATHIFDGLDDWPTHLVHLTDGGRIGWSGRMEDCGDYGTLKRGGVQMGKILALADAWLRKEADLRKRRREQEKPAGEHAHAADPTDRNGGYASGRNLHARTDTTRISRLSDLGNRGVLDKHG